MLDLFSITLFGLSMPSAAKETRNENGGEAEKTMWQAVSALQKVFPQEARMYTYLDKTSDEYVTKKNLIKDNFPIQKHQCDAFLQHSDALWQEAERQKPYISKKLYKLIMAYDMFLNNTMTVAQYGGFISGLIFPWENKYIPHDTLNRKQKRQYKQCSSGEECIHILKEAICEEIAKASS